MFNYSLKFKVILILFLVFILLASIILVRGHDAKANDLKIVSQVQKMAEALENYYSKFNAYPNIERIDVASIRILSDQGINKNGDIIFFQERLDWDRAVYLKSDGDDYTFEFSLKEKWATWGIDSREGAVCNIRSGIYMDCVNKPATFLDYFR